MADERNYELRKEITPHIQGDYKFPVRQIITVQKTRKNVLNTFSYLP
jgi:hypothetical protein